MGYESILTLVGISIAPADRARVKKLLAEQRKADKNAFDGLFQFVALTSENRLEFCRKKLPMPEESELPDEEGFVRSAVGKWPSIEKFADWLSRNGFKGSVVLHSREGDGAAWGWEFEGARMRYLELRPAGRWRRLRE